MKLNLSDNIVRVMVLSIALLFSCGEQTIKEVPNSLPTVQIQSHGDNSEFDDGYEIQFYGLWIQVPYLFNQKTSLNVLFPLRMNLVGWMVILWMSLCEILGLFLQVKQVSLQILRLRRERK